MNLTDEEIRIKVAEACGWRCAEHVAEFDKIHATMCWIRPGAGEWQTQELPNYPESLDACSEFEKTLTDEEWPEYTIRLSGEEMGEGWPTCFLNLEAVKIVASATARQRAIAYLKTKGIIP